jgi:hypothetical protein
MSPTDGNPGGKPARLFWFGAHKLLVNTELARLRQLGYEVFNPPYLSHILDQSAVTTWDRDQYSTLPPDVFERLAAYNFFYNSIDPEIAEILNAYFDAVIVTIVARWVTEILRVFAGPVLFRSYGQTSLLSNDLTNAGAEQFIRSRDNFHFLPHSVETGEVEQAWLRECMMVVPYCLTNEVFELRDMWRPTVGGAGDILITAPNILGNPFHKAHYDFLKEFFYQPHFRYMGVQPLDSIEDPQVVSTLTRDQQLQLFRSAAGFLYTYRDPRVCYLPPIEMIVFGGPVIYLSGSLLSRYIGPGGPGEAATVMVAHEKCARLRDSREVTFIEEVRASQRKVADRYDPEMVWPVFDEVMLQLLPKWSGLRPNTLTPITLFPDVSPNWRRLRMAVADVVIKLGSAKEPISGLFAETAGSTKSGDDVVDRFEQRLTEVPLLARHSSFADVIGRTDILLSGGLFDIGSLVYDPVIKRRARFAPVGTKGYVHFGHYKQLTVGRYEVVFTFRADAAVESLDAPAGEVDVCINRTRVLVAEEIIPRRGALQVSRHVLKVETPGEDYEFRVHSSGTANLYLYAVTLQAIMPHTSCVLD